MSYNLHFYIDESSENLSAFFLNIPYARLNLENHEFTYENPDTGVYFDGILEEKSNCTKIVFRINVPRPSPFGLESAMIFDYISRTYKCRIEDEQSPEHTTFSGTTFLQEFNRVSAWALRTTTDLPEGVSLFPTTVGIKIPSNTLQAVWRWNYHASLNNYFQQDSRVFYLPFVESLMARSPLIKYFKETGIFAPNIAVHRHTLGGLESYFTSCVWGDAMPCLLPSVDVVSLGRLDLRDDGIKKMEFGDCVWEKLPEVVRSLEVQPFYWPYRIVSLEQNGQIIQFFRSFERRSILSRPIDTESVHET